MMPSRKGRISAALFLAAFFTLLVSSARASIPLWIPFEGSSPIVPAYPDTTARYDAFFFRPNTGDWDYLKLSGRFPYARYFGYNLYDVTRADIGLSVYDRQIQPDPGSINPFLVGQDRSETMRNYTLWLVKEGTPIPPQAALSLSAGDDDDDDDDNSNVMILPPRKDWFALFLRIYRPDNGKDSLGGVPLPTIEAWKQDTSPGKLPETSLNVLGNLESGAIDQAGPIREIVRVIEQYNNENSNNELAFFRANGDGLFPNADNEYILSTLPPFYLDKVVVLQFKPPTFEDTFQGASFQGGKDVRYWSLCLGTGATTTTNCLFDDEITPDSDGRVTVVIGMSLLKSSIETAGYSHLPWGIAFEPVIIHRHMLADAAFPGRISNVPMLVSGTTLSQTELDAFCADKFMGDFGIVGRVYSISEFLMWLFN